MRLILTRHGETLENAERFVQGQSVHGRLSETGIEQVKKLAERLKDEKIDVIYSSDLGRSADTAKEISHHHDIEIIFSEELRERNLGVFEKNKLTEDEFRDFIAKLKSPDEDFETGESIEQTLSRSNEFIRRILNEHANDTVLLVCHAGIGQAIVASIMRYSVEDIVNMDNFENTAVYEFEITEDGNHKMHARNCTKHLD